MKYIKKFETKQEYKVGDIVVFKFKYMYEWIKKVGIIKKNSIFGDWWVITDLDNRTYFDLDIKKSKILKIATQKDIDKYMLEPTMNKYNI